MGEQHRVTNIDRQAGRCPTMFYVAGHSHMSEVFSPDTADRTVTDPILSWMKKVN